MPLCRFALTVVVAAGLVRAVPGPVSAQAPPPGPSIDMSAHYAEAGAVRDAVTRGDLAAAREAASALAVREPTGLPEGTAAHQKALKALAARVAAAADIAAAADGTAALLGACGDCHRTAGAVVASTLGTRPAVGETVGHMLDHQRAVEQLTEGLVVPSATMWQQGATALRGVPLSRGQLPRDPKLTSAVADAERRVHALAAAAASADAPDRRVAVYGQLLGTCAACHSLHSNVWGPTRR